MAYNDEINIENFSEFIFNKLPEVFHKLMSDFKKLRLKNKELKRLIMLTAKKRIIF